MNRKPHLKAGKAGRSESYRPAPLALACALVGSAALALMLPGPGGRAAAQAHGPVPVRVASEQSKPPGASAKPAQQRKQHTDGPDREALRVRYLDLLLAYERIKDPARKRRAYRYLLRLYEQLTGEHP